MAPGLQRTVGVTVVVAAIWCEAVVVRVEREERASCRRLLGSKSPAGVQVCFCLSEEAAPIGSGAVQGPLHNGL